jgi:asparagine synthase (glutamine-hydrolysing)
MCGIVGVLSIKPLDASLPLAAMRDVMSHRGPDDEGIWWSADRCVGLAHRRLSIIDLSPLGHQPMLDATGELAITFNGEIYNFLDLRAELESQGHAFRSHSDTEVILAAYRQWGAGMLERLNGMFALVLYDARERTVLLARDRAGEKPLFIRRSPGRLVFASELKAIMTDPECERHVDADALELFLAYGYVPGTQSMLRGVEKLGQGEAMRFDLRTGDAKRWAYWTLPTAPAADGHVDAAALEHELESLLEDSVKRQMLAADVPVGILLSGGLDSSLVTAMAARSGRRVKTFTISFPGHGSYDESKFARIVARHFGTDHTDLAASPATVSLLPELARQYDEPMADSSMIPTYLVSRLIREHATVALGGDGGDELFAGYPHHNWIFQQAKMRRFVPSPLARPMFHLAKRLLPIGLRGRNFILGLTAPQTLRLVQANTFFDDHARRALLGPVDGGRRRLTPEAFKMSFVNPAAGAIDQATRLDFTTYLVDDILVKVDRASMLTSLEVRAPFLDYRMIDFAFGRVPATLKADGSGRKILLRRLAARVLPKELDLERKQGFSIPLHKWFEGEWGDYMTSVLRSSDGFFDRRQVEALIAGQRRGRSNQQRIFALTLFELWRREYRVSV